MRFGTNSCLQHANACRVRAVAGPCLLLAAAALGGCVSGREFWSYVVEDEVSYPLPQREKGTPDKPAMLSPYNVKVVYNDGSAMTEVLIPILSSGQQILVDNGSKDAAPALALVPLPPTDADRSTEDAYVRSGQPIQPKAAAVSIVKTHELVRKLVREGNYALALQYADQVLKRYPNHAETLRMKGSLLLKIGERQAALDTYRKAEEVEPNPRVAAQIAELERGLSGQPAVAGPETLQSDGQKADEAPATHPLAPAVGEKR